MKRRKRRREEKEINYDGGCICACRLLPAKEYLAASSLSAFVLLGGGVARPGFIPPENLSPTNRHSSIEF